MAGDRRAWAGPDRPGSPRGGRRRGVAAAGRRADRPAGRGAPGGRPRVPGARRRAADRHGAGAALRGAAMARGRAGVTAAGRPVAPTAEAHPADRPAVDRRARRAAASRGAATGGGWDAPDRSPARIGVRAPAPARAARRPRDPGARRVAAATTAAPADPGQRDLDRAGHRRGGGPAGRVVQAFTASSARRHRWPSRVSSTRMPWAASSSRSRSEAAKSRASRAA